jgi:hypothetical protein
MAPNGNGLAAAKPTQRDYAEEAYAMKHGVSVADDICRGIKEMAEELGVTYHRMLTLIYPLKTSLLGKFTFREGRWRCALRSVLRQAYAKMAEDQAA